MNNLCKFQGRMSAVADRMEKGRRRLIVIEQFLHHTFAHSNSFRVADRWPGTFILLCRPMTTSDFQLLSAMPYENCSGERTAHVALGMHMDYTSLCALER